jgi:hypothetical protein
MRSFFSTTALLSFLAVAPSIATAQNLVIVSIGDSLAAGEGNPNSFGLNGAVWNSTPCHRSNNNGRRFASNRINNMSGVATSFFDFSCSGASIDAGLLGPQTTDQPDANNGVRPAQIDQVANFQQSANGLNGQPIDILMVSIGVNDANFAPVVTACLLPGNCTGSTEMNAALNVINGAALPNAYDRLGAAIRQRLNVRRVYITEYPNLVSSAPDNLCGSSALDAGDSSMVGISSTETAFVLTNFIRPLNDRVQQAATRNAWRFVVGPEDTFATHGYCTTSARRYVNTLQDSLLRQGNQNGTVHPNVNGHSAYADALVRQATIDFDLPLEAPRVVRTVETNTITPGPIADSGPKRITVEIAQHPGTLGVTLQHRVITPFLPVPAFVNTAMTDGGTGRLNLFSAQIPGFVPGQTVQYRVVITTTRNRNSATTTTATASIALGDGLVQQ